MASLCCTVEALTFWSRFGSNRAVRSRVDIQVSYLCLIGFRFIFLSCSCAGISNGTNGTAVGTLHWSSFYELLENSLGEGKLHDPWSFSQRHQNRQLSPGRSAKRTMSRSETPADLMSNMNEGREGGVMFDCSKR